MDHGIYISPEQVIHFSGGPMKDPKDAVVCATTLAEFAPGGWNSWVGVVQYRGHPHLSYLQVVARAKSRLGRHVCDLGDPDSEHFARWCATGTPEGSPVDEPRSPG